MTERLKSLPCASCGGCGGGCECGGTLCKGGDQCQGGALQRPQFFAGQLLTEDDLQLLSDYVAAKSRLHNRFLHGYGVVCGLLVMCNPCGGGKVVVQPGTALDCCGNEIVVPCPIEVDINAMVQALRIETRGGYDCGDPCAKPCDEKRDPKDDARCIERKGQRYCLYVRYCEVQEEPVAPYVTSGDCTVQVCKPTRIREGYRFELRCPAKEAEPDDLWRRIRCCIGEITRADKAADDAVIAGRYYTASRVASLQIDTGRVPAFDDTDRAQLKAGIDALTPLAQLRARRAAVGVAAEKEPDETQVRSLLDAFASTASAIMRFHLQPALNVAHRSQDDTRLVDSARELIAGTAERLRALAVAKVPSVRDRLIADTWISEGVQWTDPNLVVDQRGSRAQMLYAYNAPYSLALQRQFSRDLGQVREWLLERLDGKPLFADCRLRHDVLAIEVPADIASQRDSDATGRLVEAIVRYLVECICAALNPPCQPCEDSAVKLACLTVDDCEVVSICNLERTFVLSAPAIRYWLPFLHELGEAFERFCCDFHFKVRRPPEPPPQQGTLFRREQSLMTDTAPAYRYAEGRPTLTTLMRLARIDENKLRAAVDLGGNVLAMATSDLGLYGESLRLAGGDAAARLSEAAANAVVSRPQLRDALIGDVQRDLAQVDDRMRKMDEALAETPRAKAIKDLEVALAKQEKRADGLERRLAKLEKGGPA